MATSITGSTQPDPYRNFRCELGRPAGGGCEPGRLARDTEPIRHRDGADPITSVASPGNTAVPPITLQRGVTHDQTFASWANEVWSGAAGTAPTSANIVRKDLYLALHDEAGRTVAGYNLYRCWPSAFEAIGALDASGAVVFQQMVLQLEGWEYDTTVTDPSPDALATNGG